MAGKVFKEYRDLAREKLRKLISDGLFVSINYYQYKGLRVFAPNEIHNSLTMVDNLILLFFFL